MSKGERNALVIGGVIVLIIVALLMSRRSQTVIGGDAADVSFGNVVMPGMNIPQHVGGGSFVFPIGGNPLKLTMIGACCADCSAPKSSGYTWPSTRLTFVTNKNAGPTIINNFAPPAPKPARETMSWMSR